MKALLPIILVLIVGVIPCRAGPSLPAVITDSPPKIDGDLSDSCWRTAAKVSDFVHIQSGTPALERTTAWIAYDDESIYVAFECKDSRPESIRGQQKKRGGEMAEDDYVMLRLDPFFESRFEALNEFKVNAAGTQWHVIQSPESEKTEWIGDWESAVRRTPGGYSVEMRIPWGILKYDHHNPRITVCFVRHHSRLAQSWYAPDLGGNEDLTKMYVWQGVRPPAPKVRPVTMIYALAGAGSGDVPNTVGVDFKHSLTPSLSGLLALNPDFRNIEQEVDSVDFTYTERELEDRRPFFVEGSQYFPSSLVYYTRRIGEIDAGAKLVGMEGDYKLAFMTARDFGGESHSTGQIGRQFGAKGDLTTWFGSVLSEAEDGDYLTSFTTIDYKLRHTDKRYTLFRYAYINTGSSASPGHGFKESYSVATNNGPRNLEFSLTRHIVDTDYEPYLGITQETNLRTWKPTVYLWDSPPTGRIDRWQVGMWSRLTDHLDGSLFYNSYEPFVFLSWRNGQFIDLVYTDSDRPPNHDRYLSLEYGWRQKDLYRAGTVGVSIGRLAGGDYLFASLKKGFSLTRRLSVQLRTEYFRIGEPSASAGTFRQTIVSAGYDISPEKSIVGRWIRQSGRSNVYLAYRQRVRAGLDAYLIYGDPNAVETRHIVLLKLIRPL